jgi:type I restriction enzyme, S subunit
VSGWTQTALSDLLVEARPGFACGDDPEDGVFQIRMNNITTEGQLDLSKKRRVPRHARSIENYLVERGDVLFNATNSPELVGKTAYFPGLGEPAVFSNHFLRLRPRSDLLDGRFLSRWLNLQFACGKFRGMCRQWVNQATVNREALLAMYLALPPVREQRRIAEILDKADALRAKRRAAIAQLDTLTQSIFLDMFGEPTTNPKGWPRKNMSEVATVITGNTPSRAIPDYYGTEIEWIKSDNINTPHYYLTRADEGLSALGKETARIAPTGSILVTCIAGSPECIGNAAMTDRDVAFNQQINAVVPKDGDRHFIYAQIVVGKQLVQQASTAGMKGMVNKSRFERIMLIWPPQSLQREFASRVLTVVRLKETQRGSLAQLESLFTALQHRAFRGEL